MRGIYVYTRRTGPKTLKLPRREAVENEKLCLFFTEKYYTAEPAPPPRKISKKVLSSPPPLTGNS